MKTFVAATSFAVVIGLASAFAAHDTDTAQHRKPSSPPAAGQAQPPATPPDGGHTAPPSAPKTREAIPRPPGDARNEPERQRRPPDRGPVVIPYPVGPWWGPYPYPYPPSGGWQVYEEWQYAQVRLDVSPSDAQVYVDRYFAGVVDDYDGVFQHLALRPGAHLVEIRKNGFRSLAIELNLYPGESITYRRVMEPSTDAPESCTTAPLPPDVEEGAAPPRLDFSAPPGDVKFDVTPEDAEVYVDGFYAGIVDDFNGSQHLRLPAGPHHLSLKMPGYDTIDVEVSIAADRTITYRAAMKKSD